jgi:hypothetical protein
MLLFVLPVAACTASFDPVPAALPAPAAGEANPPPSASPMAPAPPPLVPTNDAPSLSFEQLGGIDPTRAQAVFAPHLNRLSECVSGSTGVMALRVSHEAGTTHYTVQPSTTLDGRTRTCLLETLSTVDVASTGDASPSARPSGFSALLRLEWGRTTPTPQH